LPEKEVCDAPADTPDYGLHFTDKPLDNLPGLNFYELQHALYAAWRAFDHSQGEAKAANREKVLAVYEEYRRRGITKFKTPVF
jgi:hypothetical protein